MNIELPLQEDLDDWALLTRFLPAGWQEKARETGAFRRSARKFPSSEALLRTLLIHLAQGCPLKETAVRARMAGLADVSGVAVWKRLRESGEWLRWMSEEIMRRWVARLPADILPGYRLRLVDATAISEPGATGSDWRIHYSVELSALQCDFVEVTSVRGGETFRRFPVQPGDLLVGDRVYANRAGVEHVTQRGGDVLVRMNLTSLPLETESGEPFLVLDKLKTLRTGEVGDWPCSAALPRGGRLDGRICAIKRSQTATELARGSLLRRQTKRGHALRPETLESSGYIFLFTTVPAERLSAAALLEVYRGRWQVELVFKRLKSLLALGCLPKHDPQGARAWLHGKILVAFLVEALLHAGESFSPWGYSIGN
jgi:hypothetical protein